jgi:hypothetical protein
MAKLLLSREHGSIAGVSFSSGGLVAVTTRGDGVTLLSTQSLVSAWAGPPPSAHAELHASLRACLPCLDHLSWSDGTSWPLPIAQSFLVLAGDAAQPPARVFRRRFGGRSAL